jgi:hypothetical protein
MLLLDAVSLGLNDQMAREKVRTIMTSGIVELAVASGEHRTHWLMQRVVKLDCVAVEPRED